MKKLLAALPVPEKDKFTTIRPARSSAAKKCQSGSVYVEFCFTALAFFTIMFLSAEMARFCYHIVATEYITGLIMREAALTDASSGGPQLKTIGEIEDYIINFGSGVGLRIRKEDIQVCAYDTISKIALCGGEDPTRGVDRQLMSVRISYDLPVMLGSSKFPIEAIAMWRNEPFET